MAARLVLGRKRSWRFLEEPSSETLPRPSNSAFVVLQNYPRTPQSFWRVEARYHPNAAKIIEPTGKEKGTTLCVLWL